MTAFLVVALALVVAEDKPAKKADEAKSLDGEWKVVAMTFDGEERPKKALAGLKVVIGDGKLTAYVNDKKGNVSKVTLDSKKKQIDLLREGLDESALGIYELKGDKLKLCYGEPGKKRPEKIESEAGDRVFLLELERVKKE